MFSFKVNVWLRFSVALNIIRQTKVHIWDVVKVKPYFTNNMMFPFQSPDSFERKLMAFKPRYGYYIPLAG